MCHEVHWKSLVHASWRPAETLMELFVYVATFELSSKGWAELSNALGTNYLGAGVQRMDLLMFHKVNSI